MVSCDDLYECEPFDCIECDAFEDTADTAESMDAFRGAEIGRGSGLLGRETEVMIAGDKGAAESCEEDTGAETFLSWVVDLVCRIPLARVLLSFPPTKGPSPAKSASRRSLGDRGASRAEPGGEIGDRGEDEGPGMGKTMLRGLVEEVGGVFRVSPDILDVRLA